MRYVVTLYQEVGNLVVDAESEAAAVEKVRESLVKYFNLGYSGNLKVRVVPVKVAIAEAEANLKEVE